MDGYRANAPGHGESREDSEEPEDVPRRQESAAKNDRSARNLELDDECLRMLRNYFQQKKGGEAQCGFGILDAFPILLEVWPFTSAKYHPTQSYPLVNTPHIHMG